MIDKLEIKNFRVIEDISIEPTHINLFIGSNNSGKSSILQAIHFTTSILQSISMQKGRAISETNTLSPSQVIYAPFDDINSLAYNKQLTQTNGFSFYYKISNKSHLNIEFKRGKNANLSIKVNDTALANDLADITNPFSIYTPGLSGIPRNESKVGLGYLRRVIARGDANLVLRNTIWFISRDTVKFNEFMSDLESIFGKSELAITYREDRDEFIDVKVQAAGDYIPLDAMGTGFLQVLQILAYIHFFQPKVVLLDEPDSHLHASAQRSLVNVISKHVNTQFFISTHSRHIYDEIDKLTSSKVFWMKDGAIVQHNKQLEILMDLGAIDSAEGLLSANGIKYLVLTEDSDKSYIDKLIASNTNQKYQIWSYKGISNVQVAESIHQFASEISPTIKCVIHMDGDLQDEAWKTHISEKYKLLGCEVFFTEGCDTEYYYCREDYLKELNPENTSDVSVALSNIIKSSDFQKKQKKKIKSKFEENEKLKHREKLSTLGQKEIEGKINSLDLTDVKNLYTKDLLSAVAGEFQKLTGKNLSRGPQVSINLQDPELKKLLS